MSTQSKGLAVVTGASSGIGAVYADRLARRGYDLLLVARSQEAMSDLAIKLVVQTRRKVQAVATDLADPKHLAELERILRQDSRITVLVNNAGFGRNETISGFRCRRHEPDDRAERGGTDTPYLCGSAGIREAWFGHNH